MMADSAMGESPDWHPSGRNRFLSRMNWPAWGFGVAASAVRATRSQINEEGGRKEGVVEEEGGCGVSMCLRACLF